MSEEHDTDYRVYMAEESCTCVEPEDDASNEYAAWDDKHPHGEGVGGWEGRICYLTVTGTYCEECSDEQGDWSAHIVRCPECEYEIEDDGTCQCMPVHAMTDEDARELQARNQEADRIGPNPEPAHHYELEDEQ